MLLDSGRFRLELRPGVRVLTCTKWGRGIEVAAPARVLIVRNYRSVKGAKRSIIVVEVRKRLRERRLTAILRKLGSLGKSLRPPLRTRILRDAELVHRIGQLWTGV
jgi:hypothetical protein